MHQSEKYWSEPNQFQPERFMNNNVIDPFIYAPFGVGHRQCIGKQFALVEGTIALANLLRFYKPKLSDPKYRLETEVTITLRPKYPLLIDYEKR
jgi:cytochrome P450